MFDKVTSSSIELLTSDGSVAVKGTFDVMLNLCNITYVTTTAEYDKLLIHVHNGYTTTRTIRQCVAQGIHFVTILFSGTLDLGYESLPYTPVCKQNSLSVDA